MHILLNPGKNLLQSALEQFKGRRNSSLKKKTTKNMARDEHGPEFDDRLIKLVRENPAIYDMGHPHYRRTPVRMAIWDNIARELGSPSRYLQTKWKNIRYNYLQEQKCLETGVFNTNIRKRRFTADLSFLRYTAYRRDVATAGTPNSKTVYNGSDNDSNSFMYPDNLTSVANNNASYEVIELDQSDDEGGEYMPDVSAFLAPMNDMTEDSPQDPYAQPDMPDEQPSEEAKPEISARVTRNGDAKVESQQYRRSQTPKVKADQRSNSPCSPRSNRSSPLLTPMKAESSNGGGDAATKNGDVKFLSNGSTALLSEVTIRPLLPGQCSPNKRRPSSSTPTEQLVYNTAKRRATPTLQSFFNDPIELYCLSLVDCLRAMPRSERERVKFEFSKILKDARYTNQS